MGDGRGRKDSVKILSTGHPPEQLRDSILKRSLLSQWLDSPGPSVNCTLEKLNQVSWGHMLKPDPRNTSEQGERVFKAKRGSTQLSGNPVRNSVCRTTGSLQQAEQWEGLQSVGTEFTGVLRASWKAAGLQSVLES